jgi:FtsZ-interacting cell division protein ZipA
VASLLVIGALVVVALLVVFAWSRARRQRSNAHTRTEHLREIFGPEYDRAVAEKGDVRSAETELIARQKRVAGFDIKPVEAAQGEQLADEWQVVKASFVDDPSVALRDAEALVERVMAARGYPEGDFQQHTADLSVDHPVILEHYRAAHEVSLRHAEGHAETEDLRQAMINDHVFFVELLGENPQIAPVAPTDLLLDAPTPTSPGPEVPVAAA